MYFHQPQPDNIFGIPISLLGVIATIILGVLAIFGEQIRSFLFRSNLREADSPVKTSQSIDGCKFLFYRLPIKNVGRASAREVRVLLTYTKAVENFIPVPLNWTHWNKSTRDISVGETAYLDILRKRLDEDFIEFCWSSEAGVPEEPTLKVFDSKLGDFLLQLYERDRKVGQIKLRFSKENSQLEIVSWV